MLSVNEDALICDMAETYGILDCRALPVRLLATLAAGLRDDSRIKMQIRGEKIPQNTLLLASAVDRLAWLCWAQSEDGRTGVNQPLSMVRLLTGAEPEGGVTEGFATADDFEAAWAARGGGAHG